jgi:hypothetical protein
MVEERGTLGFALGMAMAVTALSKATYAIEQAVEISLYRRLDM